MTVDSRLGSMMLIALATFLLILPGGAAIAAPVTERIYLSGKGPADAVPWDFVVSAGRRAGEQAKIPVPSNWEQHGFGAYRYGDEGADKSDESGMYRDVFRSYALVSPKSSGFT